MTLVISRQHQECISLKNKGGLSINTRNTLLIPIDTHNRDL